MGQGETLGDKGETRRDTERQGECRREDETGRDKARQEAEGKRGKEMHIETLSEPGETRRPQSWNKNENKTRYRGGGRRSDDRAMREVKDERCEVPEMAVNRNHEAQERCQQMKKQMKHVGQRNNKSGMH